uniref:Nucleic acid binding protein n=1 Tax=Solanum tuberosum TaxID=4113 RepID=M1C039_SOLTU
MEKRSGNVKSVQRDMLCNQIGKLTLRLVALENIDVIVVLFSQAEETARVTAASNMHNPLAMANNINYHFIGTPLGPNMAQHFSSLFKPVSNNNNNENSDPLRRDQLSLWNNIGVAQEQDQIDVSPSKRRHIQIEDSVKGVGGGAGGGGQTRDFLGVGVQSICHPSAISRWI